MELGVFILAKDNGIVHLNGSMAVTPTSWLTILSFAAIALPLALLGQWVHDEVSEYLALIVLLPAALFGFCAYVGTLIRAGDDINRLFPKYPSLSVYLGIGIHVIGFVVYQMIWG